MRLSRTLKGVALVLGLGISLSACASSTKVASLKEGACKAFEAPQYAVKGKTRYDQNWIDDQVEAGVGACAWKRPATRPASFDAAPVVTKAEPKPAPATPVKRRWWQLRKGNAQS